MICIIGGGPSCISLLCCMIKNNIYHKLKEKIIIFEKSNTFGSGALKNYFIRSNSSLSSFMEIVPDYILDKISEKNKNLITAIGYDTVYLPILGDIFEEIGYHFQQELKVFLNSDITKIEKKSVYVNNLVLKFDKIISCIGGHFIKDNNISSYDIISGTLKIKDFYEKKHILILGASHTAWSVAWKLITNRYKGKITFFVRSKVKIYCVNKLEAKQINFTDFDDMDICPDTKSIFRFAGLRGDSKKLWMNKEKYNIQIKSMKPEDVDCVIKAYGFERKKMDGDEYTLKFGFMSGIYEKSGEPSFSKSKDGIWIYGNTLGNKFLKDNFMEFF